MTFPFHARHLDIAAFAQAKAQLNGHEEIQKCERLAQEASALTPESILHWQAQGEQRSAADGSVRPALHLRAHTTLALTCQRCMGEVMTDVAVDRHFIFVPDETTAAALDDESEDDVLVLAADFDLLALVEDEMLMALPLVPRHGECPEPVPLAAQTPDFDAAQADKPQPFAALAALKSPKP
ncbi:MAG: DUF177 domain-containing protein [Pseudomonadota bacterium]|nr:DUF177 domain-containing protein [Pseudomonadota bacterium]